MPRGRGQARARGRRRGRSCDRRPCARRLPIKPWTDNAELLVPPANPQLPAVRHPPSTAMAQFCPDQSSMQQLLHSADECSQDPKVVTALMSAIIHCQIDDKFGHTLQERLSLLSAVDSDRAKVHYNIDTKVLTPNIGRSSTAGEANVYRYVPVSPQDFENFQFHSFGTIASRSPDSNPDRNEHSQTVSKDRAQSAGPHSTVTDPQIHGSDFLNRSSYICSTKQDKSLLADHNHNILSSFTSGSSAEVFQSDNENSVSTSSPAIKHQCFHSTFPSTLYTDTAVNSASTSVYCCKETGIEKNDTSCVSPRISQPSCTVWDFAPPLEVPQMWPVLFDRPTKQNVEFIFETIHDSVLPNAKISCQPEFVLPSRNTSTLSSLYSLSKWRFKPPPKWHLSKLRSVKSRNAALKRIQEDECSLVFIALEQGFFVFCSRCYRPGRMHPRNKNKIIKKRFHRKYWNNLQISKNEKLSKISDKNGEIKCTSCHRTLWKCHQNNNMFRIMERTSNSHHDLVPTHVMNKIEEITRKAVSGTEDSTLKTTNTLQNHLPNSSDKHITKTTAEDENSKVCSNLQLLNQSLDPTSKFEFPNGTFVLCLASEKDAETILESQRVQVPCQTGQEFMEMSNKFNPHPYKISGIFGSENGISACLEDQGDLSNEFDFDINNSGELTLPSYKPQLVVSKDKTETWNFGKSNVFVAVMHKPNPIPEGLSHIQTTEKTSCNSKTADPPTGTAQTPLDVGEQFIENTHQGSKKALCKEVSSNGEETIGRKNGYIQTKDMNSLHGETYHPDVVHHTNDTTRGQLTSSESRHIGNKQALTENISSDIKKIVFHKKNNIENVGITADNHKLPSSVIIPQTVDNMREQLNTTEKRKKGDTGAQLEEISHVMIEKLGHKKGSVTRGSCNEENAGQNSTMSDSGEAECSICIKEEVGEFKKETLEVVNANLLQNSDLCSNHSTRREKINTCESSPVRFSGCITVKEETVKNEEGDLGPDGTCCIMCEEEKKLMLQMSATIHSELVDAAPSSVVASKDKLLTQNWLDYVSSGGLSSDTNSSINNLSGEVESLPSQSSNSSANSTDVTRSDNEQQPNPSRSPGRTVEEVAERNEATSLSVTESLTDQQMVSMITELQNPINSSEFFCSDNNNCIEEQVPEQLNSLSFNSTEAFDYAVSEHEADEIENQLRNLLGENSEDSFSSEIKVNDTVGSVMFMERDTEYRLCNVQELSNRNEPHGGICNSGIAHEDRLNLTCDSSSSKESQNCVIDTEYKITGDSHKVENEIIGEMSAVTPQKETTEYKLCNFQEVHGSINQPIIEHEVDYQQSSDISSTNECHDTLIMEHESSSEQKQESHISYFETDSDSSASVQISTEISLSESTVPNQLEDKLFCTYPLNSISSEDVSKIVVSGCSHISSTTEMIYSETFLTNQADGRAVSHFSPSRLKTKEACKSLDSDCTSTLDRVPIDHPEDTSNNQPVESQVSKYPQNNLESQGTCDFSDFGCTSTLARTSENVVDFDGSSAAETMQYLKNTTNFPEIEQKDVPVIRVSIPLSSITDPRLLESLMSERKRRKAGHTGSSLTQTAERRNLEKLSVVQYSPTSSSKRKATNKDEITRMNGKGKQTFEKVSQVNDVGDQSPVQDLLSYKGSEKKNENDDARARCVTESSHIATTKYRAALDTIEKPTAKAVCKEKSAHQSAVVTQCEDGSEEEGELQICEEPLEGGEEGLTQDDNSEGNVAVISQDNIVEEKLMTSGHTYKSDTLIKAQNIESINATAHHRDDVFESSHYSSGNQITQQCEDLSSVPDEHEPLCKIKPFTGNTDVSQMIVLSNIAQKEPLSPPQKLTEIKQPCSPLQNVEHHFSRTSLSDETSGLTVSGDGNLSNVKPREAMELGILDASDVQVALQSEINALSFDKESNKSSSDHRMGFEDTATPFRKISRKNINEKDVHVKSSEEKDSHRSVGMNKVLMCSSSKGSNRRISSKRRMTYADLESLPPSYHILRRDLNEVLEQEKLYQCPYSLPRKVPKKLSVAKVAGYRRRRECQKVQMINDTGESTPKKIRREGSDYANSEVSAKDQEKSYLQKETMYAPDQDTHTTKGRCEQDTNLTTLANPDAHQHQKKKKPAVLQPEEMEVCYDKPALPSAVSPVDQCNMLTEKRQIDPVKLIRWDGSYRIQSGKKATVVETGDNNEKTPVTDKCGETGTVPDKNVAPEHKPSQERDNHDDTSSASSKSSEIEMVNKTCTAKEQLNDQPKQRRDTSQKIQEYDKDDEEKLCVEEEEEEEEEELLPNPPSKRVKVTDETVCSHGHKLDVEASHSQDSKLPPLVENKKNSVCTEAEQSHQCPSQSPDEITAPENNVNNSHQATTRNSPVHLQNSQKDFAKEDKGNRQQEHSLNCGTVEEGDKAIRSSSRATASLSEDEVSQNCVERRSESPCFKNIDRQMQETTIVCWQQKLQETMADLFSLMKKGEPFKDAAVAMMTQALEQMQESQKKTQQSLQHTIQTEEHVLVSDAQAGNTEELLVPKQLSQEAKVEFQNPVSECEKTGEQYITQKPLQKSATDFQDPGEELPLKHPVSECNKTNEQHITKTPLQKSATGFQGPVEELSLKHPVSECSETNEQHITQKPLQKSATDFQDPLEKVLPKHSVSECDEPNEQHITQKPLQRSASDFLDLLEKGPLKHPVSEHDETNEVHITQKALQKPATDFQDPLEKMPLKHPVSDCDKTNEQHITQKPLQKSATDFQDPLEKVPLKPSVSECDETNEEHITQKTLQKPASDFQGPLETLSLKHLESECDKTNDQLITQKTLQKPATDFQDPLEKVPLKHPVPECDETNEEHIIQKPLQKSATDFQDPLKKLPKSTIYEAVSQDISLIQREPSTHEVGRSQTQIDTVPPAQHTGCGSRIHDIEPRPHTPQSQQTVTSKQFHPQESLSCSEHLKQYSKQTPADQEETMGQQNTEGQCAKERQSLQRKEMEPHNPQSQMLTQQQVQDQHRIMLNTIKQQKQQFSNMQQIAQENEAKHHKEIQQSSLQPSVIQSRAAVQQWHHTQQRPSQHHQIQCVRMEKFMPQQQNVYSGSTEAEKAATVVQNPMGCHQALLRQQQQMQHLASLEQQPLRQLSAVPNTMGQPQQSVQQQMEWQQQRAAHLVPKQYPTVEQQTVPQNQQQAHPYHRFYYPQIQQPYQMPHPTEVQLRPNYPPQYHSRFSSPQTMNSNSHLLRQMSCGPLEGQQMQPQQQQYPQFHHQQQLEKWHLSRRTGTEEAATVPAVLASPSMSGGSVMESEFDRRRVLSREAINSFDAGHRLGAVPSSSCPVTPANTENMHTAQPHPSQAYTRTGPHTQPTNSTAPMQAPLNTGSVQQRDMKIVPTSTVDEDQRSTGQGGRLKIPTPPRVSAFVERIMKNYQPDILDTEDIFRHQYKLPERGLAPQFAFPQESVFTRHGTTSIQQLSYSQPVMMFSEHTRFPASLTQPPLNKTVHSVGQSLHRVFVPPPASSFDASVNNLPINVPVNCVQPIPISKNVNVHDLHTELAASSSTQISPEASLPSVSENLNCDCNIIDLSQDKNTSEDIDRCHIVRLSERTRRGTETDSPVMQKTDSTSSSKTVREVPRSSDCIQDNVPDNPQLQSSSTETVYHSVPLGKKRKSETLCGTPEKRLCQDTDNDAHALPNTGTLQVTAMDLSPSTVVECTAESIPSQSSSHVLGTRYTQLSATSRPALDSKQHAMNGKGASSVNCGQQNQGLCTADCCEQSRCATHTTRLAAAGSTCCGTSQQSQHSPIDER